MAELGRLGGDDWFRLGDRDLATHLFRTQRLREGATLSEVTAELASGVGSASPPPDVRRPGAHPGDPGRPPSRGARGRVPGLLRPAAPRRAVAAVRFDGADGRARRPGCSRRSPAPSGSSCCPSNPVVSIGPILAVPGVRDGAERPPRPRGGGVPDRRRRGAEGAGRPAAAPSSGTSRRRVGVARLYAVLGRHVRDRRGRPRRWRRRSRPRVSAASSPRPSCPRPVGPRRWPRWCSVTADA